jgi:hypothetical protein
MKKTKSSKAPRDGRKLKLVKEIVKAHLTQVSGGGGYAAAQRMERPTCGCGPC